MSGFTPINVDSQGRILPSQTILQDETEHPSKRRKLRAANPWTPRKPRQRRLAQSKEADVHELVDHLDQRNLFDAAEEPSYETQIRPTLQGFRYMAGTMPLAESLNFASPDRDREILVFSSQPLSSTAVETSLPDYASRFKNSVTTHTTDDILVPATQNQIVPQTPPQRIAAIPESSAHYQYPTENWDDAVDAGWGVEDNDEGDDEDDPEATTGYSDSTIQDSAQNPPNLYIQPALLRDEFLDADLQDAVASVGLLSDLQEVYDDDRYEMNELENALLSAEAALSIENVNQSEDSTFSAVLPHSSLPSTPYPAVRVGDHAEESPVGSDEDLLDELDDQDIYDMIDVADQVSAALQRSTSLDQFARPERPRLAWNAPREYKMVKKDPPQPVPSTSKQGGYQTPMLMPTTLGAACGTGMPSSGGSQNIVTYSSGPQSSEPPIQAEPSTSDEQPCSPTPFVRGKCPAFVKEAPFIAGTSSQISLRVCFRIGELFKVARSPDNVSRNLIIELYAKINRREHYLDELHFTFGDLFFDRKPPFLDAVWRGWQNNEYWKTDAAALTTGIICRALGRIEKQVLGGKWVMNVLSAQLVCWDDVEYVKGIVCAQ